jgi:hypothetical protein
VCKCKVRLHASNAIAAVLRLVSRLRRVDDWARLGLGYTHTHVYTHTHTQTHTHTVTHTSITLFLSLFLSLSLHISAEVKGCIGQKAFAGRSS